MKHEYLPTVQCKYCKMYHIIKCYHAESGSEADSAKIAFSSNEYLELRMINEDE